jgi:hypothetical protein
MFIPEERERLGGDISADNLETSGVSTLPVRRRFPRRRLGDRSPRSEGLSRESALGGLSGSASKCCPLCSPSGDGSIAAVEGGRDILSVPNPKSFQAFTDDGSVYGGAVTNFVTKRTKIAFDYEYVHTGVKVTGRFEGEHEGDSSVIGEWTENASAPINGAQDWSGTASFKATDEDRLYLRGTWIMTGSRNAERWFVDAAKK